MRAKKTRFTSLRLTQSCTRDLAFLSRHFKVSRARVIGELIEREAALVRTRKAVQS